MEVLILASGALGYFISLALVVSPFFKNKANGYLAVSLFQLASLTALGWHAPESGPLEFLQSIMWEFFVAATLFTYFLHQLEHPFRSRPWFKWLYAPWWSTLVVEIYLHLDYTFGLYDCGFDEEGVTVQLFYDLEDGLSLVYNVILTLWARKLIRQSANISGQKRRWLLRFNLFILCTLALWFLSSLEEEILDTENTFNLLWVLLSFLSWWLLYYGVFRLQLVEQKDALHQYLQLQVAPTAEAKPKRKEIKDSGLVTDLLRLMEEEALYKDPLLSRKDIADRLTVSEGHLSQVINQELQKSVVQFVNSYRIAAAKQMLQDPTLNKYSVEAIGMEAGFKSKSVFYSTFKASEGLSPGAFRKLQDPTKGPNSF
ncbi:MAG: helix-turn-helix domain-containing protein [Bacteroidota bacterium]